MARATQAGLKSMIRVGRLTELKKTGVKVVHSGDRPIAVFVSNGSVFAIDNRCPHMGFPLHKGTVCDGILTCHWHEARFDLAGGDAFDLWADDVPAYDTRVKDGVVYVATQPRVVPDEAYYLARLRHGMQQTIGLIQAKSLIGLLRSGHPMADAIREIALFGSRENDDLQSGMTLLTIVANVSPHLSELTGYYALYRATRQVAADCDDVPPRRPRQPLHADRHDLATLKRWLRQWTLARHRDGIERVLLTALADGTSPADLTDLLCSALNDRVYAATGHIFDFTNKAFELLDKVGWRYAPDIFPLLCNQMASARGAEESAHWHHPVELIEPLRAAEAELPVLMRTRKKKWTDDGRLVETLLGENPMAIIEAVMAALGAGATPPAVAQRVAYAAAMRIARFAVTNDVGDWISAQHAFTYANAVHQAVTRSPTPDVTRAILHAALAVYQDRFLNVPPARLPGERRKLDDLPEGGQELRDRLLEQLDRRADPDVAARLVARYVRLDRPIKPLIDTLTLATVREDVDFHPMQVLDGVVRQLALWPEHSPQREHLLVAAARQLAAFCPTRRGNLQTATIALRLHRGDRIYEED
ncbi:MAG: hypothetical protein BIFFINMI_02371 [Phycisphaerae bacterium]|nr:hypothetical protein [Phycisphaerae bacterium]